MFWHVMLLYMKLPFHCACLRMFASTTENYFGKEKTRPNEQSNSLAQFIRKCVFFLYFYVLLFANKDLLSVHKVFGGGGKKPIYLQS